MDWIRSGWANDCGIELFTHGRVICPYAPADVGYWGINTGWPNQCGQELFTLGWIGCGTPVPTPDQRLPGGGSSKKVRKLPSYQEFNLNQAMREDEEILVMLAAYYHVIK